MSNKEFLKNLSNEIIKHFDFQKVVNYMSEVNWTWAQIDENGHSYNSVPNEEDLKNCVLDLFEEVIESDSSKHKISIGGFLVEKNLENSPGRWLRLKFKFERDSTLQKKKNLAKVVETLKKKKAETEKKPEKWLN